MQGHHRHHRPDGGAHHPPPGDRSVITAANHPSAKISQSQSRREIGTPTLKGWASRDFLRDCENFVDGSFAALVIMCTANSDIVLLT